MNHAPPRTLLDTLREGPETRCWLDRLRRTLYRRYAGLRDRPGRGGDWPDFDDAVSGFVADVLLPEDWAAVKALLAHARDDRDAAARLRIMFERYLRRDRRGILHNKWRALRRVLPELAEPKPLGPDVWGPPGTDAPPPGESDFLGRVEAWAAASRPVVVVRGETDATQNPVILHDGEIRRLAGRLFELAGCCFRASQVFRFIRRAADLDHWERVYGLLGYLLDRDSGEGGAGGLSADELDAAARCEAATLEPVQAFFLRCRLGPGGAAAVCQERIRERFRIGRTAFYDGPLTDLRKRLVGMRAEDPRLPLSFLEEILRGGDDPPIDPPDGPPNSPILQKSRGNR